MPQKSHKGPKKSELKLPECVGCHRCGDISDEHLYALGYNNKYYCRKCFFKLAIKWPKPGRRDERTSIQT